MRLNPRPAYAAPLLVALAALSLSACGGTGYEDDGENPPPARSIDLSGATGNLPLASPQDAGKAALASLIFSDTATSFVVSTSEAQTKAVQNCGTSGTRESTSSGTPPTTTIRVVNCLDGSSFSDGLLTIKVNSISASNLDSLITFGEPNSALLTEARDPADYLRFLLAGTIDADVSLSGGNVSGFDALLNLQGRVEDLSQSPGVNFGLTQFDVSVDASGPSYLVNEQGDFRVSGDCGAGQGTIATPTDLIVNKTSGAITGGQLFISNAGGVNATVTFNANGSVDIITSAGGEPINFTRAELEALCEL